MKHDIFFDVAHLLAGGLSNVSICSLRQYASTSSSAARYASPASAADSGSCKVSWVRDSPRSAARNACFLIDCVKTSADGPAGGGRRWLALAMAE